MPFKYPCFISYRHGQFDLLRGVIEQLYAALAGELEAQTGRVPYLDRERLKGGDFYNEALAQALCESACMIVVYTPPYFDSEHPYCTREFFAMQALEELRLPLLPLEQRKHGLIVTVCVRGQNRMPAVLTEKRIYYKQFETFLLADVEMKKHPQYAPLIREIGQYIADRWAAFQQVTNDPCLECASFALPAASTIMTWLGERRTSPAPFPR